jgi:PAS domain S-box-containing protein
MIPAPAPANELERLAALRIHEVLDTAPEEEFDDLTRLASYICKTPIALVSLIDASRQWFKSRFGIDVAETPREVAFCSHTILGGDVLEVPNALADERFADNPLVTGSPGIRFYAGAPLTTAEGLNLGSICVIDRVPRKLDEGQLDALRTISRQVVHLLELRVGVIRLDRAAAFRQAILDSAVPSIISTTPDGVITVFNRGAEKMLGYSADEIVGKVTPVLIHDPAEVAARADELTADLGRPVQPGFEVFVAKVRGGKSETREWIYVRKDGTTLPVRLSVSEIVDRAGKLTGFLGIARDHTEVRRSQQELERLAEKLRRSNEDLEQFAYVASHDLQEPLRMIASYLQLLERRCEGRLDAEAGQYIGFAVDGAKRMQTLIRDLLAFSRVSASGGKAELVDLAVPVRTAMEDLKVAIAEKQAVVTIHPLPAVPGSAGLFAQLFQNLLSNALKFCAADTPRIDISAKREGGQWIVSVSDNGIGIEPEYREQIFAIFKRLHGRDHYPGTGIGLAICKRIVEHHGGRIWVESAPGRGSTFSFSLPAAAQT